MAALDDAVASEIETRLSPRLVAVRRLQAAVDAWVAVERALVTTHVARDVLSTLGQTAAPDADATAAQAAALAELRAAVEALAPIARPAPPTRRAATIDESKNAARIIAEIDRVDVHGEPSRLVPMLRMLTAETRAAMDPLSPGDPVYVRLYEAAFDRLKILHRQSGVRHGVLGLDIAERQDWAEISQRERRTLDKIDRSATPTAPTLYAPLSLVAGKKR